MRLIRSLPAALLIAAAAVALCACSQPARPAGGDLVGEWLLTSLGDGEQQAQGGTIAFAKGGSCSGLAPCNSFKGPYELTGSSLSIGPLATTQRACPLAVMQAEERYLEALDRAVAYSATDSELTLFGEGEKVIATFERAQKVGLEGDWVLLAYNNGKDAVVTSANTSKITARFASDKVTGASGCGPYEATYIAEGDAIRVSAPTTQDVQCEPELKAERDLYLAALQTAATWKVSKAQGAAGIVDRLELRTANGAIAVQYEVAAKAK